MKKETSSNNVRVRGPAPTTPPKPEVYFIRYKDGVGPAPAGPPGPVNPGGGGGFGGDLGSPTNIAGPAFGPPPPGGPGGGGLPVSGGYA